ncbi:MAG: hypothetical protein K2W96_09400, partial [Gemmataceae bacterium]|nr:hypothetical protein [Gemmataceae bacterium]
QAMGDEIERGEVLEAADRAVADLLDTAGIAAPPIDAVALARLLGLAEKKRQGPPPGSEEAKQLLAAQLVGEHLKPALLRALGIEGRPLLGASLGGLAAVRVLAPTPWFAAEARASGFDLPHLKGVFSTAGGELLAWRMLDLPEPALVTVIDNGSVSKRKANAFRVPKELGEAERRCLVLVQEESRPHRVRIDGWTVQGWPVHGADRRREILRAVPDD